MIEVDLHLHTTHSDGRLSPTELVRMCGERGLRVISITDHDSTDAMPEALEAARGFEDLTVIPGIELSTDAPDSEIHVLGYFVDYESAELQSTLRRFRDGRERRAEKIVENLKDIGVEISWDRVQELSAGGAIGRPHIAQAMVEAGYVEYPRDAFDQYLGRTGIAYVERLKLTPAEAAGILKDNGALPVMAHPTFSVSGSDGDEIAPLSSIFKELKMAGLVGFEVYYKNYGADQVRRLASLASELDLVPCGGTDYHASGNPDEPEPGTVGPPMSTVEALMSLKRRNDAIT